VVKVDRWSSSVSPRSFQQRRRSAVWGVTATTLSKRRHGLPPRVMVAAARLEARLHERHGAEASIRCHPLRGPRVPWIDVDGLRSPRADTSLLRDSLARAAACPAECGSVCSPSRTVSTEHPLKGLRCGALGRRIAGKPLDV